MADNFRVGASSRAQSHIKSIGRKEKQNLNSTSARRESISYPGAETARSLFRLLKDQAQRTLPTSIELREVIEPKISLVEVPRTEAPEDYKTLLDQRTQITLAGEIEIADSAGYLGRLDFYNRHHNETSLEFIERLDGKRVEIEKEAKENAESLTKNNNDNEGELLLIYKTLASKPYNPETKKYENNSERLLRLNTRKEVIEAIGESDRPPCEKLELEALTYVLNREKYFDDAIALAGQYCVLPEWQSGIDGLTHGYKGFDYETVTIPADDIRLRPREVTRLKNYDAAKLELAKQGGFYTQPTGSAVVEIERIKNETTEAFVTRLSKEKLEIEAKEQTARSADEVNRLKVINQALLQEFHSQLTPEITVLSKGIKAQNEVIESLEQSLEKYAIRIKEKEAKIAFVDELSKNVTELAGKLGISPEAISIGELQLLATKRRDHFQKYLVEFVERSSYKEELSNLTPKDDKGSWIVSDARKKVDEKLGTMGEDDNKPLRNALTEYKLRLDRHLLIRNKVEKDKTIPAAIKTILDKINNAKDESSLIALNDDVSIVPYLMDDEKPLLETSFNRFSSWLKAAETESNDGTLKKRKDAVVEMESKLKDLYLTTLDMNGKDLFVKLDTVLGKLDRMEALTTEDKLFLHELELGSLGEINEELSDKLKSFIEEREKAEFAKTSAGQLVKALEDFRVEISSSNAEQFISKIQREIQSLDLKDDLLRHERDLLQQLQSDNPPSREDMEYGYYRVFADKAYRIVIAELDKLKSCAGLDESRKISISRIVLEMSPVKSGDVNSLFGELRKKASDELNDFKFRLLNTGFQSDLVAAETLAKKAQTEATQAKAEASTAHKEVHKQEGLIKDLTTKVTTATEEAKKAFQWALGGLIAAVIGIFTPFLAVMGQQRPSALQGNGSQNNNFNLNLPTVNAAGSNSSSQGAQPQGT